MRSAAPARLEGSCGCAGGNRISNAIAGTEHRRKRCVDIILRSAWRRPVCAMRAARPSPVTVRTHRPRFAHRCVLITARRARFVLPICVLNHALSVFQKWQRQLFLRRGRACAIICVWRIPTTWENVSNYANGCAARGLAAACLIGCVPPLRDISHSSSAE